MPIDRPRFDSPRGETKFEKPDLENMSSSQIMDWVRTWRQDLHEVSFFSFLCFFLCCFLYSLFCFFRLFLLLYVIYSCMCVEVEAFFLSFFLYLFVLFLCLFNLSSISVRAYQWMRACMLICMHASWYVCMHTRNQRMCVFPHACNVRNVYLALHIASNSKGVNQRPFK